MRFFRILAKDARVLTRHRALLAALLAYPFLLAVVLGGAFGGGPAPRLDLAVVNGDAGGAAIEAGGESLTSEDLVGALADFSDVRVSSTEARALSLLRQGDVDAVLIIPPGFVAQISSLGQGATLRVVVDESDPVRAEVARNAVTGAIDSFVEVVIQKKIDDVLRLLNLTIDGGTTRVAFIEVQVLGITKARERLVEVLDTLDSRSAEAGKLREVIAFLDFAAGVLGNAETYLTTTALPLRVDVSGLSARQDDLLTVALPGALVLGVFWTGALAASLLVARDHETGVRRRLAAAPTPRGLLAGSKTLVALAAALVPAAILLALGTAGLGAVVRDPALTLVALVLSSLASIALGALAALLTRSSAAAALLVVLALVPMLVLGGLFYPVAYMPDVARAVASVLPMTLATDALRGAMVRGSDVMELAPALGGLALFAALVAVACALLARRGDAR